MTGCSRAVLWAEVTIAYNEIEDDAYAFYVEDLRPIQLSRFDFNRYCEGRSAFSRDAWIDIRDLADLNLPLMVE